MIKYKDTLKLEFKESLSYFNGDREFYHIYRINRLLTNGSILNFDYYFLPSDNPTEVICELNLDTFGKITFVIDVKTSYGKIVTQDYKKIISTFLEEYNIYSEADCV
uniref:Uncharacterized protein n=1 Tax=Mammaliicoccus phage MSShimriz1 TaxID=3230127 RepID=A0AAU8GSC2_9VIRU